MIKKKVYSPSLFCSLADMLDQRHPLYRLADKIDWRRFEEAFTPLYSQDMGAPAKDIRLMCGLLILKHVRNLSDESVVAQWSENAYYQYFCGMDTFSPCQPCASTELVPEAYRGMRIVYHYDDDTRFDVSGNLRVGYI